MDDGIHENLAVEFTVNAAIQKVYDEFGKDAFDQDTISNLKTQILPTFKDAFKTIRNTTLGKMGEDAVSHLSAEKCKMMKEALDNKTFHTNIADTSATFSRGDIQMYDTINLTSGENILKATGLQKASIVLEAIIFVLEHSVFLFL